jgi:hypothetical protein
MKPFTGLVSPWLRSSRPAHRPGRGTATGGPRPARGRSVDSLVAGVSPRAHPRETRVATRVRTGSSSRLPGANFESCEACRSVSEPGRRGGPHVAPPSITVDPHPAGLVRAPTSSSGGQAALGLSGEVSICGHLPCGPGHQNGVGPCRPSHSPAGGRARRYGCAHRAHGPGRHGDRGPQAGPLVAGQRLR